MYRFVLWLQDKKGSLLYEGSMINTAKLNLCPHVWLVIVFKSSHRDTLPTLSCVRISMGYSFLLKLLYIQMFCFTTNDLKQKMQTCLHPATLYLHSGYCIFKTAHSVCASASERQTCIAVWIAVVSFTLCT